MEVQLLEINYILTERDYLKFNLFHAKNSKTVSKSLALQRFLAPVIFLIGAFVFSWIGNESFIGLLITFSIIGVLWIIYYPKYFYGLIIKNTRKMLNEGKNDGLLGEHKMILSEIGIIDSNINSETQVKWIGIKKFEEVDNYFYIYNTAVSAYILPKSSLINVEETKEYFKSKLL